MSVFTLSEEEQELENQIRAQSGSDSPVETTLGTSERIIARVTDGIYREPWAAFRELVVNAYDADASYVVIETGQPDFKRLTVRDDGLGMSPTALVYILKNIGGSSKRTPAGPALNTANQDAPDLSPGGRPLIGKIGIGLFAVAQLTQHFQIITKAAGESHRISATIRLRTHDEDEMHLDDAKYVAGDVAIIHEPVPESERDSHGTSIVLYHLRDEIRRALQSVKLWEAATVADDTGKPVRDPPQFHIGNPLGGSSTEPNLPWEESDSPEERFKRFFDATGTATGRTAKSANLEHLDQYFRLIWKLSLSLPLDYIDSHPFDLGGKDGLLFFGVPQGDKQSEEIDLAKSELLRGNLGLLTGRDRKGGPFTVALDGIELRCPISLSRELVAKKSRIPAPVIMAGKQGNPFPEEDLVRAGGPLSFEAYLYWNNRIVPKETAGVLVRIKGASGTLFDRTFMNYLVSEQNRLRQITAEIFIHEGLDSAINIDRESFNYSHPHFLFIQKWLHRALRLLVNRLKAISKTDLARAKRSVRDEAIQYALDVWKRRYGPEADEPIERSIESLPEEIGGVEIEWPSERILMANEKPAKEVRISTLAAVLEAYSALSSLPIGDRAQFIKDLLGIPETDA